MFYVTTWSCDHHCDCVIWCDWCVTVCDCNITLTLILDPKIKIWKEKRKRTLNEKTSIQAPHIWHYWDDNLFSGGAFCSHFTSGFIFLIRLVNNIVNFRNLIHRKFWKHILDLWEILDVILGSLGIWRLTALTVWFWLLITFEEFRLGQDAFTGLKRNRQRDPGDASLFAFAFFI